MKRGMILLLCFVLVFSNTNFIIAKEKDKEEYGIIYAEFSDNLSEAVSLDVMVLNDNVYINTKELETKLSFIVDIDKDSIIILNNEEKKDLPRSLTIFSTTNKKVSHLVGSNIINEYEAPFPSVMNKNGNWIPLEYSLLILNCDPLIIDNILIISHPKKSITDIYGEIVRKASIYTFDWNKDLGYTEKDYKILGASSHLVNQFNGILNLDGYAWLQLFQQFANSNAFDAKYGKSIALLMCTESDDELKELIDKIELQNNIFGGKLGDLLNEINLSEENDIKTLYNRCNKLLDEINTGNTSHMLTYNRTYQQLERMLDKQYWFSKTGGNIIQIQKKLFYPVSALDICAKLGEYSNYMYEFKNQDTFSVKALAMYLDEFSSKSLMSKDMINSMRKYNSEFQGNKDKYSMTRFFEENVNDWILDGVGFSNALGIQANIELLAWNLTSNLIPFISNGLNASDDFEIAMYCMLLQSDSYLHYNEYINKLMSNCELLTSKNLYTLSNYCYIYLKSCYITRNAALSSLNGKSEATKEKIKPLINKQNEINRNIAEYMTIIKSAQKGNKGYIYGFLPSDNKNYLKNYDGSKILQITIFASKTYFLSELPYSDHTNLFDIKKYNLKGNIYKYKTGYGINTILPNNLFLVKKVDGLVGNNFNFSIEKYNDSEDESIYYRFIKPGYTMSHSAQFASLNNSEYICYLSHIDNIDFLVTESFKYEDDSSDNTLHFGFNDYGQTETINILNLENFVETVYEFVYDYKYQDITIKEEIWSEGKLIDRFLYCSYMNELSSEKRKEIKFAKQDAALKYVEKSLEKYNLHNRVLNKQNSINQNDNKVLYISKVKCNQQKIAISNTNGTLTGTLFLGS